MKQLDRLLTGPFALKNNSNKVGKKVGSGVNIPYLYKKERDMKNQIDPQAFFQFKSQAADLRVTTITPADIDQLRDLLNNIIPDSTLPQLPAAQKLQLEQTISDLRYRQREILGTITFTHHDRLATKMIADISSELARLTNMINTNCITGPLTSMFN
jgi:hypothetical protein